MSGTYSVYNIKVDNQLSFTPGPTAGNVLAIDANGNTSWVPQSGGSGGGSGTSGTSGSSGTSGVNGLNGQSSSFFLYKANTNDITGNPDHTFILWNNATQIGATAIHINHLTKDNVDIDIFLGLIREGSNLTIQHTTNSAQYQTWNVNGTPTLVSGANNYWVVPVDLINSTVSFSNNEDIFIAISADSGTSGTSGVNGATGATGGSGPGSVGMTIDGGGSVITTGLKGYISVPYNGTITGWVLLAGGTGSIAIDVWKTSFAGAPPTVANSITGTGEPTLSSAQKAQNLDVSTSWSDTSVSVGDVIGFNVDSVSTITRVNLDIKITKS